jgi:hypothetical protein
VVVAELPALIVVGVSAGDVTSKPGRLKHLILEYATIAAGQPYSPTALAGVPLGHPLKVAVHMLALGL